MWNGEICRVRKSRRQSVTLAFLFPHFPYHQAKNAFSHLHLPVPLCSTTSFSCILEEWRCHANDKFLFLPFEGQFKLSPWRWVCISDADTCACEYCKWIQWRSGSISFLKTEFFSPHWNTNYHVCLQLKCGVFLLAPLAWSLFIFKWMLSVTRITHLAL